MTVVDEEKVTLQEMEEIVWLYFCISLHPDKQRKLRNTMNRQTFL